MISNKQSKVTIVMSPSDLIRNNSNCVLSTKICSIRCNPSSSSAHIYSQLYQLPPIHFMVHSLLRSVSHPTSILAIIFNLLSRLGFHVPINLMYFYILLLFGLVPHSFSDLMIPQLLRNLLYRLPDYPPGHAKKGIKE